MIARVVAERGARVDSLDGLRRIGIDEISHRKAQRYLTLVVDHDQDGLVWGRPGRDKGLFVVNWGPLVDKGSAVNA